MSDLLIGLAHNLALLLALVFSYGLLRRFGPDLAPLWRHATAAAVFASAALLAMLMPIRVADQVIVDNRIAVVALAGPFGGGWASAAAACAAALFRLSLGGVGAWPGVASLLSAALLGWLLSRRWSQQRGNLRWPHLLGLGLASVAVTLPWTFALPRDVDPAALFLHMAPAVATMYPLAILGLGSLLRFVDRSVQLDRSLQASERRFRLLFERAPDAILVADPDSGTIVDANQHACELLARSRDALVGIHYSQLHPPGDLDQVRAGFEQQVAQTRSGAVTPPVRLAFARGEGDTVPVECVAGMFDFGGRQVLVGFFRDLREREQAARALASAEALTRHLVETAGALIVGVDSARRLVLFNPFAQTLTGWRIDDLRERDWLQTLCPQERLPELWAAFEALDQGTRSVHGLAPLLTRDGRERLVSWSHRRIEGSDLPLRTISIGIDVTEQRDVELQLRQTEKLHAIGQLAGGIAHDFNNQLQIIGGLAEGLLPQQGDAAARHQVELIRTACERSADLTSKLLAFSRKAALRREPLPIRRIVDESVVMLERSIDKRIRIQRIDEAGEAAVLGDIGSLQNALLNLALNARDAMPEGGTITFHSRQLELSDQADLPPGHYVALTVRDTGCGIPEDIRERIFDPFVTTKPTGKGTGLGLAAVYGTVQEHGGAIRVESSPGVGSAFTLLLPLARDLPAPAGERAPTSEPQAGSLRILLVDDEDLVRGILRSGLERFGHAVSAFADGAQALDWLDADAPVIDLALVDLNMPGMSGIELIRELHRRRPTLPVVISTGLGPQTVDAYVREHPLISVLCKPFSLSTLNEHIQQRLGG